MIDNAYEKLSKERKRMQERGECPDWFTTGGYQLFKEKYLYEAKTPKQQYERIAKTAAQHTEIPDKWEQRFFELMWKGWMSLSTPILANMGTNRGLPVSCSGQYVDDSINGFYKSRHETAILTKHGFGTSAYLGDIRPRGSPISVGGKASGVLPVFKGFVQDMREVNQGNARRGAWAGYIEIDHVDFDELCSHVEHFPDDANIGWIVSEEFIQRLQDGDEEANRRFKKCLKTKLLTGKGYFFFKDKISKHRPQIYKDKQLDIKASNLC